MLRGWLRVELLLWGRHTTELGLVGVTELRWLLWVAGLLLVHILKHGSRLLLLLLWRLSKALRRLSELLSGVGVTVRHV